MKLLLPIIIVIMVMFAGGCSSTQLQGPGIAGDHSAHFNDVFQAGAFDQTRDISVHHVFTLRNESGRPVTIVSHRTTTDTVWHFEDRRDAQLPRMLAAGETVRVNMRGRLHQPKPRRFYTELTFSTGETMKLEMHVEN